MNTRKNIILWALYDFANSILSIVFFLYFTQWIVVERGIADIYLNLTFTLSALFLLISVPISGALLDKYFRRITGLRITTIFTALMYASCAIATLNNFDVTALIFFTLGLYVYLLTFTFYTPLLNDISTPEKVGKISGFGIAANYSGQFFGLLMVLPFSTGKIDFFDASPRAETLLPAILIFIIFTLPMLFFFHEPKKQKKKFSLFVEAKDLWDRTKNLVLFKGVALFLIAYFLFNDAILTASNNFPIFLEQVWGVSDTIKTFILAGILITSAIGGWFSGLIADKVGHKKTLMIILTGWLILLPAVAMSHDFTWFTVTTTLMGFWFGASWAVSRSVMSYLAPKNNHNLAFAYFGLVERASAFLGPLVWGLTLSELEHIGDARYRYATLVVTIFIFFGLIVLTRVRSDRPKAA